MFLHFIVSVPIWVWYGNELTLGASFRLLQLQLQLLSGDKANAAFLPCTNTEFIDLSFSTITYNNNVSCMLVTAHFQPSIDFCILLPSLYFSTTPFDRLLSIFVVFLPEMTYFRRCSTFICCHQPLHALFDAFSSAISVFPSTFCSCVLLLI